VSQKKKNLKINCNQLRALRHAMWRSEDGYLGCDRCCGKALAARGFAEERGGDFFITQAGWERARKAADTLGTTSAGQAEKDPRNMQDLPSYTTEGDWRPITASEPTNGVLVMTRVTFSNGTNADQALIRGSHLWAQADGRTFIMYVPTHWKPILTITQ
jgi:hypothetical protein